MYLLPERLNCPEKEKIIAAWTVGECFDILLHNKAQDCQNAITIMKRYGIFVDCQIYVLVQFATKSPMEAPRILLHYFQGLPRMDLFSSCGTLYGMCCLGELDAQRLKDFWQRFYSCAMALTTEVPEISNVIACHNQNDTLGLFHAANAIRHTSDLCKFIAKPIPVIILDSLSQLASLDNTSLERYRMLCLALAEQLCSAQFDPEAAAQQIWDAVWAHNCNSIEGLHLNMQSFNLLLLNYLRDHDIIDPEYLSRFQVNDLMIGDNEWLYRKNLTVQLQKLHKRRMTLNQKFDTEEIHRIRVYVEQHIASQMLSVSQVAELFGIHRSVLSMRFRSYYGMSLGEFIQQTRVNRAMLLIQNHPEYNMEQIAERSGYCSLSTMYRNFRSHGLKAPAQYQIETVRNCNEPG